MNSDLIFLETSNDLSCGSCEDVASPSDCEKVTTCRSNEVRCSIEHSESELAVRHFKQYSSHITKWQLVEVKLTLVLHTDHNQLVIVELLTYQHMTICWCFKAS